MDIEQIPLPEEEGPRVKLIKKSFEKFVELFNMLSQPEPEDEVKPAVIKKIKEKYLEFWKFVNGPDRCTHPSCQMWGGRCMYENEHRRQKVKKTLSPFDGKLGGNYVHWLQHAIEYLDEGIWLKKWEGEQLEGRNRTLRTFASRSMCLNGIKKTPLLIPSRMLVKSRRVDILKFLLVKVDNFEKKHKVPRFFGPC